METIQQQVMILEVYEYNGKFYLPGMSYSVVTEQPTIDKNKYYEVSSKELNDIVESYLPYIYLELEYYELPQECVDLIFKPETKIVNDNKAKLAKILDGLSKDSLELLKTLIEEALLRKDKGKSR